MQTEQQKREMLRTAPEAVQKANVANHLPHFNIIKSEAIASIESVEPKGSSKNSRLSHAIIKNADYRLIAAIDYLFWQKDDASYACHYNFGKPKASIKAAKKELLKNWDTTRLIICSYLYDLA